MSVSMAVPPGARSRRNLVTAAILAGTFVSAIELTIVGTAMPRIAGALGGSDLFAWVISVYLLTSSVVAPLSGKLADLFGRKPVYQTAMALFLLGSAASGAAQTMTMLIVARAIQGIGGGALGTVALTIVGDLYTPVERGRVQGFFSAVWGIAGGVGPVIGGFLVDHLSWRWVFYINLPFGVVAMLLLAVAMDEHVERKSASLDVPGALLLTVGLGLLQFAGGGHGAHGSSLAPWLGAASAVLLVVFVMVERRASAPIVPLQLVGQRLIGTGLLASLMAGGVMFALTNFVPLYMQGVMSRSAAEAGAILTPMMVAWPTASVAAGFMIARVPARWLVRTGMIMVAIAGLLPVMVHGGPARVLFLASGLLFGTGMGLSSTTLLIALQSAVDWQSRGIVTAGFSFCRTMGGTLGVIVAGLVQSSRLAERGIPSETIDAMLRPGAAPGTAIVRDALAYSVYGAFMVIGVFGLAALAAAWAFPRTELVRTAAVPPPEVGH